MTTRLGLVLVLLIAFVVPTHASADERYAVTGLVISVRPEGRTFVASIEAIPNFMSAMTMPFQVRDAGELAPLRPGAMVSFTLVVAPSSSWAEEIVVQRVESLEQQPLTARRLALIQQVTTGHAPAAVAVGTAVPDFRLIDHRGRSVALADFAGKVVAINFTYTTCQLPDFCLRLVNHFGALQHRFAAALGHDLIFLTITFDPVRDQPDVLGRYASRWDHNPDTWRFLTGELADVRPVLELFGMVAFASDGLVDHGLRTVVIGRDGRLVVNLEGNRYSSQQLGDTIDAAMAR